MTFQEAVRAYAVHASRSTVRDSAIIQSVNHAMGISITALLVSGNYWHADDLRNLFVRAVEEATQPVELPSGVRVTQTPHGPVTHVDLDRRLHAEIREDGHTYIEGERID